MSDCRCKIGKITPKLSVVEPMPHPINHVAVEYARYLLRQCESGEFRTIAVCAVNARGYVHTAHAISQDENPVLVSGAIRWLDDRVMAEVWEAV